MIGGLGRDTLTGGSGLDRFDFNAVGESKTGATFRDFIKDFKHSQHDRIDLRTIDANTAAGGNQNFKFIGSETFADFLADHAGILGMVRVASGGMVQVNVNGNLGADLEIKMTGGAALSGADFIL